MVGSLHRTAGRRVGIGAETVRARSAGQNIEYQQDYSAERNKTNEQPPAAEVRVVQTTNRNRQARNEDRQPVDNRQHADGQIGHSAPPYYAREGDL